MKQAIHELLLRSSDAILVIRLADATVLGANRAFFSATGHPQRGVVGGPVGDLLGQLSGADGPTALSRLCKGELTAEAETVLWTGSGDLRIGHLTAVVVEVQGQRHALCAIRDIRDASPEDRRLVARQELHRILRGGGSWPDMATGALQALGKCLRWECGVLWSIDVNSASLTCSAVWRKADLDLERFEEASRKAIFQAGDGLPGQAWLSGKPLWIADDSDDPNLHRRSGTAGAALRARVAFPAWEPDGVVGVVELNSVEPRRPDEALLQTTGELGRLFGWLVQALRAKDADLHDETGQRLSGMREPVPSTVSDALRNLLEAVDAMTQALQRQRLPAPRVQPPASLRGLVAGIGEVVRFLEEAIGPDVGGSLSMEPMPPSSATSATSSTRLPTGLTLKAVSQRTGIPAATLRTWERRYGFLRPARSSSGYRIYGEEEVTRIERVKYLLEQGVRIGEAMASLTQAPGRPGSGGGGERVGDQAKPPHDGSVDPFS